MDLSPFQLLRYKIWVKEEDLRWMNGRRNNGEGSSIEGDGSSVASGEAVWVDLGSHNFFGESLDGDGSGMALQVQNSGCRLEDRSIYNLGTNGKEGKNNFLDDQEKRGEWGPRLTTVPIIVQKLAQEKLSRGRRPMRCLQHVM